MRAMEPGFDLVERFHACNRCALAAFLAHLDTCTLADLLQRQDEVLALHPEAPPDARRAAAARRRAAEIFRGHFE